MEICKTVLLEETSQVENTLSREKRRKYQEVIILNGRASDCTIIPNVDRAERTVNGRTAIYHNCPSMDPSTRQCSSLIGRRLDWIKREMQAAAAGDDALGMQKGTLVSDFWFSCPLFPFDGYRRLHSMI